MGAAAPAAGYSGKALPAKLRLRQGHRLLVVDPPSHLDTLLAGAPDGIVRLARLALPLGLVDVKVCAVDATWSGLKLVRRRPPRGG